MEIHKEFGGQPKEGWCMGQPMHLLYTPSICQRPPMYEVFLQVPPESQIYRLYQRD
jgi:hypothetical protein